MVAFLYAGLFTYAAVYKLLDLPGFRNELNDSSALGSFSGVLSFGVPIAEIFLSVVLLIPRFRFPGMLLAVVLMGLFTGYILLLMNAGPSVSCSCGGFIQRLGPVRHLLFNLGFIVLGLSGIISETKYRDYFKILRVQNSRPAGQETGEAEKL